MNEEHVIAAILTAGLVSRNAGDELHNASYSRAARDEGAWSEIGLPWN